MSWFSWISVHT